MLFQGVHQVAGVLGVALDQEDPGLARGVDQAEVVVVVEQLVLEVPGPDLERGQAVGLDRLAEDEPVLALLDLLPLADDLERAPVDLDVPLVVVVGVDDDLDVERLALQDLRGDVDGGDLDLGVGPGRQGDGRDGDPGVEARP